jgi:hypothetical protein
MSTINHDAIIAAGGSEWIRDGMHRYYFDVAALAGLQYQTTPTGRAFGMVIGGRELSGTKTRAIAYGLERSKAWIDARDMRARISVVGSTEMGSDALFARVRAGLEERLPGVQFGG